MAVKYPAHIQRMADADNPMESAKIGLELSSSRTPLGERINFFDVAYSKELNKKSHPIYADFVVQDANVGASFYSFRVYDKET